MKTKFISFLFAFGFLMISVAGNAQEQNLKILRQQSQVVKFNGDLGNKKIDLEKERQINLKIAEEVKTLDKKSDRATNKFSPSDPKSTAKDARDAAKVLRRTEVANRDLRRSNMKIERIERDIKKLEEKLDKLQYTIEISGN